MKLSKQDFMEVIERTPLVSIDLVIRDSKNRILLGRRKNEPAKGKWFVPGSRICKGESLRLKKGTGLKLRVSSLLGTRIDRRSVFGL